MIDPVAMAMAIGTPPFQQAAMEAAAREVWRSRATINEGQFNLDMFLRSLGVPTNIAGAPKPPTFNYPMAEDAYYKRQYKAKGRFNPAYQGEPGTVIEFVKLAKTPMADWDVPDPSHLDANVTVRNLGDVEDLARDYVRKHPQSHLRLYQTPGGYRAWELGEQMTPLQFGSRFSELAVDPDYERLSKQISDRISTWTPDGRELGVPYEPQGFWSRISHKPGRTDWVAQPIATFAGKDALIHPRSELLVRYLHDEPIRQTYLSDGPVPGASVAAIDALKKQLPTVSSAMRRRLESKFSL